MEFAVGPAGIERRATERRAALDAARGLGVAVADLPEAADRAHERREELESEVADLESRLVAARVEALRSEFEEAPNPDDGFRLSDLYSPLSALVSLVRYKLGR